MNDQLAVRPLLLTFALTVLFLVPIGTLAQPTNAAQIRAAFHQQGFKTDLSDFDFTVPKDMADRGAALSNMMLLRPARPASALDDTDLLTPVTNDTAMVIWKQKALAKPKLRFEGFFSQYEPGFETNIWPVERDLLQPSAPQLDSATAAALSGPFGYDLNASAGLRLQLPHLRSLKNFSDMFAGRVMLALHDHNSDAAWTNLLALTRLVTGWQVEPIEVSQNTRFVSLKTAYNATWQALQAGSWPDDRLSQLQHEWESLDVFRPLPDTVAFMTASYISAVQKDDDASAAEDEKALLLSCHDKILAMRQAIQSPSWPQMQLIPDVTNRFFVFPSDTNLPPAIRRRFYMNRASAARSGGFESLAGRASEAETRRRLLITAIALERSHSQHGSYPNSLDALTPDFLKTPLADFMNGQPLHYSLKGDGHFLLYSVGLDGEDNGGKLPPVSDEPRFPMRLVQQDTDIVWPLPASSGQVDAHFVEKEEQEKQRDAAIEQREANDAAQAEIARQAAVKELLSNPKFQKATWTRSWKTNDEPVAGELTYNGQPFARLITNEKSSGTNSLSLDVLFRLKPVHMDLQGYAYFQLPLAYDLLTNLDHPDLGLIMDSLPENHLFIRPQLQGYIRATNGDCLMVWNPMFDRPGLHALQADMYADDENYNTHIIGPVLSYSLSNLFWFDWADANQFDDTVDLLHAQTIESNATFRIEIRTDRAKPPIKTLSGSTSNGIIFLKWDLLDDHGNKVTNSQLEASFTITLPDSSRTQTLKLPQYRVPR